LKLILSFSYKNKNKEEGVTIIKKEREKEE
jgi:hypothetical protein